MVRRASKINNSYKRNHRNHHRCFFTLSMINGHTVLLTLQRILQGWCQTRDMCRCSSAGLCI